MIALGLLSGLLLLYLLFVAGPVLVMFFLLFGRKKGIPFTERDLSGTPQAPYEKRLLEDFRYFEGLAGEEVSVLSEDGVKLAGTCYSRGEGRLAICMHGFGSTPLNCFASAGRFLLSQGFDVLLAEQRAHGRSGGAHVGLGLLEQEDVLAWCDWADRREDVTEVLLYGVSMGAASVAYASDRFRSGKLRGMILDCGFSAPDLELKREMRARRLPAPLLLPLVRGLARLFLKIDLKQPVTAALERTALPALFVHGGKDTTVPLSDTENSYRCCGSRKSLYIAENAGHACAFLAGGGEAEKAFASFLKSL